MYDNYDLFEQVDRHVTRTRFKSKTSDHYYPSEASVKIIEDGQEEVLGGCIRASYFRLSKEFAGDKPEARAEYIFIQGKSVENFLVDLFKEMGIWHASSVRFTNAEYNISGELDAVLVEPDGTLYGAEIKSFYGYYAAKEICGNKWKAGKPKDSHLLQTLVYLYHFRGRLPYFRIIYFARDEVKRKTFKIELHQEGDLFYPKVDGIVDRRFTVNDVLARYKELDAYVKSGEIPPVDFELQYSDAKIEDFFAKGKVSKTKYNAWKAGKLKPYEHIGDWQCSYCPFKAVCWGENSLEVLEESEDTGPQE